MNFKTILIYSLILFLTLLFLLLIKLFNISYPLTIVSTTKSTELAAVGEGKVEIVPDTAFVDVGITVNNAPSVDETQKIINKTNNQIIVAMRNIGIERSEIKTTNYSINPNYSYDGNLNKITGYNGNATISIKVKNIQLTSKAVEEATKAGANQVNGTTFMVDKPEKYREQARDKAIKNAREQAEKLAKNLGIRLGKIVNIVESTPSWPYAMYKALPASGAGGGGSPEIEPGTQTITSVITLYFEKK